MPTLEEYLLAKSKLEEAKKEAAEAARSAFADGAKSLLERHPVLNSFGWTQYTPYFNDGDECVFSANTDYPHIRFAAVGCDDDDDDDDCEWSDFKARRKLVYGGQLTEEESAGLAVIEFLRHFDDEAMEAMFGDHVKVTVTRDGTEVDEYEHD